jgi:GDP-mannose 6-dehydrogenase
MVEVIERLIGKGYELRLYDRNVNLAALIGANRDYILNRIPHISRLMTESMEEVLKFGETIVIGNGAPEFRAVPDRLRPGQVVVDLVRVVNHRSENGRYEGICW